MTVSEMAGELNRVGTGLKQAVSAVSATVAGVVNAVRMVQAQWEASLTRVAALGETLGQAQRWLCRAPGLAHRYCRLYRAQIAGLRERGHPGAQQRRSD